MATVEFIKKRITGKENEIVKLEKKLERIHQAEATNWEKNPYYYSERDINYTVKEIEAAKKQLEAYQIQLQAEEEKNASRNVKPILDFLEAWKERVTEYYMEGFKSYFSDRAEVLDKHKQLEDMRLKPAEERDYMVMKQLTEEVTRLDQEFQIAKHGRWEDIPKTDSSWSRWGSNKRKVEEGKYEWLKDYFGYSTLEDAADALAKLLKREAELKYDDIINRTNSIVGQITDATNLSIGLKGDLNGFIVGTRGKASVNTIGAGGHSENVIVNVNHGQIFHFRTLIKEVEV